MSQRDPLDLPDFVPPPISSALEGELGSLTAVPARRPVTQLAKLVGVSVLYGAGLLAIFSVRDDAGELPMGWMVAAGLLWLVGFALPIYWALVPRAGSMMPRWKLAGGAAIVMAIGFVALGLAIHPSGPSSVHYGSEHFVEGHWCIQLGVATAIVPVILGSIFLRGALPVASRWVAAGLGAGGGSLGGLVLHLHCDIADALHVGIIHGGVVGVSALLAAAIVPRATHVP
ncbi:MAG: NrsF family protein [Kofleriaceae bacterium]